MLPALLQGLDGIHAQHGLGGQRLRFGNQGLTLGDAGFLGLLQALTGFADDFFPLRLHLGIGFFAQVAGIAPTLAKLVQGADLAAPVAVLCVCSGPGLDLVDECGALGTLGGRALAHFVEPGLHDCVGLVAGGIKAAPEAVVGQATLVGLFPGLAQLAQGFLHLAAAEGGDLVHRGGRALGRLGGLDRLGRAGFGRRAVSRSSLCCVSRWGWRVRHSLLALRLCRSGF